MAEVREKRANSKTSENDQHLDVVDERNKLHKQEADTIPATTSSTGGISGDRPPDGGVRAWLQVLGAWSLFFFGVFQTYYEAGAIFTASSSEISWIGSIQSLMVLIGSGFAGPIHDHGGYRWLLGVGAFGTVFGHMMLSLCTAYWQALLAQGFVIGMSSACLYIPAVAIISTYFSEHLGLALGLAASGSSTGGIIYPIVFYRLLEPLGFAWSVRILGFMALATLAVPLSVMQMRVKPGKVRSIFDHTAWMDVSYVTFVAGLTLGFVGIYVGVFYASFFGQAAHLTDANLSFYLVPILNAASVFGRTIPNWLSDKIGPLNVITPCAFMVGVILLCNLAVQNAGGIIVTTLIFGFFSGVFVALPPAIFVALTPDRSKIGTRIGMGLTVAGLGVLAGGPGAGGILDSTTNRGSLNWTGTWVFGGVTSLAAGIIFGALRVRRGGLTFMAKV